MDLPRALLFTEGMRYSPAHLAPALLTVMAGFQAALALGAPWGRASYGGQHVGRLPGNLRAASAVSVPVYLGAAAALTSGRTPPKARRLLNGVLTVVGAGGAVVNALSPSWPERGWAVWSTGLVASTIGGIRPSSTRGSRRA